MLDKDSMVTFAAVTNISSTQFLSKTCFAVGKMFANVRNRKRYEHLKNNYCRHLHDFHTNEHPLILFFSFFKFIKERQQRHSKQRCRRRPSCSAEQAHRQKGLLVPGKQAVQFFLPPSDVRTGHQNRQTSCVRRRFACSLIEDLYGHAVRSRALACPRGVFLSPVGTVGPSLFKKLKIQAIQIA